MIFSERRWRQGYSRVFTMIGGPLASHDTVRSWGPGTPVRGTRDDHLWNTCHTLRNMYAERWRSAFAELAGHDAACIASLVALGICCLWQTWTNPLVIISILVYELLDSLSSLGFCGNWGSGGEQARRRIDETISIELCCPQSLGSRSYF